MVKIDLARSYFAQHREAILADWFELLRIPSIGTDRQRLRECAQCAAWLKRYLRPLGFEADIRLTNGQPVLLAERPGKVGAPVVLFYGHYDVQPADPLELWKSDPFAPELRDGRVYARGASDNKGQLFAFLQGVAALFEAGVELPTIRLVFDGEEESGSGGLLANLTAWRQNLQADVMMVGDVGVHESGRAAIIVGLRGIVHLTVPCAARHATFIPVRMAVWRQTLRPAWPACWPACTMNTAGSWCPDFWNASCRPHRRS